MSNGTPTPEDRVTREDKFNAFEWLRLTALSDSTVARHAAILMVELTKAASSETGTPYRMTAKFDDEARVIAGTLPHHLASTASTRVEVPSATASETSANDFSSHKPAGEPGLTERGPSSAIRARAFEDSPVAWLIERVEGDKLWHEVVLSPLTDDTYMNEGDAAYPLFREVYTQEALDQSKREAHELHKGLRIE
jgi:hypothetical protein